MKIAEQCDLAERFEGLELDAASFRHQDHVAAAYAMLRKYPFIEATTSNAQTIHTMATRAGATMKFHVTVTIAFMAIIAERMESSEHDNYDEFAARHPDLFSGELLKRYYTGECLSSDVARKIFVMPDNGLEHPAR